MGATSDEKGTYRLPLPAGRIINRAGSVELFNIEIIADQQTGSRGSGERQFNNPTGLDIDPVKNEILVADTGNDRIVRLSADGRFVAQHGGFGLSFGNLSGEREDSLDDPYDVAVGGFSNFYVADHNNERICIFDSYRSYRGTLFPKDGDRRNRLSRPRGIKVDSENNIWVVEGRADRVLKISPSGDKLFEVGGFGWSAQQLKDPTQIDISSSGGEIYIADRGKGRIAIFDRLGSFIGEIRDHLKSPTGVAIDADGLVFVCDDQTNELSLYTPNGIRLLSLDASVDNTRFRQPSDIALTSTGIFMVDSGNHRVLTFKRKKTGSSVAWQATDAVLE
ncbi:MAG: NHL repeat-containing protein [Candidatus Riflebacteria bacterium]|nr:NHL repeat-containing protein [Candidatus Riflebacteria bacterium]